MRGLDTNLLVYAFDLESTFYPKASKLLREMAEGDSPWAIPWPCLYEFLRVVTHPFVTKIALSISRAWKGIQSLLESPSLILLSETEKHAAVLDTLLKKTPVSGNLIHDAHIAALFLEHGVRDIITADHDFRRFEGLNVINPF